ncbi:hypothetical protein BDZ97DRAFT_2061599 [Flammula alnicola]|nr:hypothetical protein BDZ97DRAFT_2061599 [Flammula alnicola]
MSPALPSEAGDVDTFFHEDRYHINPQPGLGAEDQDIPEWHLGSDDVGDRGDQDANWATHSFGGSDVDVISNCSSPQAETHPHYGGLELEEFDDETEDSTDDSSNGSDSNSELSDAYDDDGEIAAMLSDEEKMKQLDEMLDSEEDTELWKHHVKDKKNEGAVSTCARPLDMAIHIQSFSRNLETCHFQTSECECDAGQAVPVCSCHDRKRLSALLAMQQQPGIHRLRWRIDLADCDDDGIPPILWIRRYLLCPIFAPSTIFLVLEMSTPGLSAT